MAVRGEEVLKVLPPLEVATDKTGGVTLLAIAQGATPVMVKGGGWPELAPFHAIEDVERGLRLGGRPATNPFAACRQGGAVGSEGVTRLDCSSGAAEVCGGGGGGGSGDGVTPKVGGIMLSTARLNPPSFPSASSRASRAERVNLFTVAFQ